MDESKVGYQGNDKKVQCQGRREKSPTHSDERFPEIIQEFWGQCGADKGRRVSEERKPTALFKGGSKSRTLISSPSSKAISP